MKKSRLFLGFATVAAGLASMTSTAQSLIDPIGFCPPPATAAACTTPTGPGSESIGVGTTSIGMYKNGNGGGSTSASPWYLLVLVPEATDGAVTTTPTLAVPGFNSGNPTAGTDIGDFLSTTPGSIYTFAGTVGDGSMNAANLFGALEQAVFGSQPADFEVFEFTFTPAFSANTAYEITATGLTAGTWLAGTDGTTVSGGGNPHPYSTPFTTAGLVCGYPAPGSPSLCDNRPPPVPEPATLALMGLGLAGIGLARRRRVRVLS